MAAAFTFNLIHYFMQLNDSLRLMKHTVATQSFPTSRLFSHSITPHLFIHYSSHSLLPPPWTTAAAPLWGLSCWFQNQMPDTIVTLTQVILSPALFLFIDSRNTLDTRCLQVKACAGVSSVKERRKCRSKIQSAQHPHILDIMLVSAGLNVLSLMQQDLACSLKYYG